MTERRQALVGSSRPPVISKELEAELRAGATREETAAANKGQFKGTDANTQKGKNNPDGVLKNFKPVPNPMGDLFQGTYHFSFYLDTDLDTEQGKGNEFVIAETGLTGMNIQSVEIDTFVGANIKTRNATATSIEIKIYEPLGAMLPDLLFQAAVRKNIRNYLKAPWFLKLKLHGYDEKGNPTQVGNGWLWKLTLIEVASNIAENGTIHTITAMPIAEVALNNQYCMLPVSTKADGVTVGDQLKSICKTLNESIKKRYGDTNPPYLEFAVDDRPYPYDTKVGINKPFDHKVTSSAETLSNTRNVTDYGLQTSQFAPGTDVPAVIDQLMARSETAVKMARISRELPPQEGPDEEFDVRDVASILHRVDTKVEYLSYDVILGDYCKKITYIVRPYSSLRILTSMGRAQSFDKEKSLNKNKAAHAIERSFMKKQYDYIFTGKNTEVEKFDINVNFRWMVSVPMLQGWINRGTAQQVDPTSAARDHTMRLEAKNNELNSTTTELDNLNKKREGVDPSTPEDEATAKRRDELTTKAANLKQEVEQLSKLVGAQRDALNKAANDKTILARKAEPQRRITDGEDDVYENARDGGKGYGGAGRGDTSYMPITIVQDPNNPAAETGTGSSNDNNANKSVYGALLNQLYGSMDGNLQSLQLEIRGDPYWLGPGNDGKPFEDPSNDTTPNFMNGEHIFVFRFKMPVGYDETTGTVSLNKSAQDSQNKGGSSTSPGGNQSDSGQGTGGSSNIFTGFYAAVQVTNHFREGRFSQTLNGTRIQGWYYENIIEGREITAEETANYTDSQSPASQYSANSAPASATGTTGQRGSGYRVGDAPRGTRNNNPANMEDSRFTRRQPGYVGSDGRFAQFDTVAHGIQAHETLLRHNYLQSPTTVRAVITRYAPPKSRGGDNSSASFENYVASVEKRLGKKNVSAADTSALAYAMRQFESPGSA